MPSRECMQVAYLGNRARNIRGSQMSKMLNSGSKRSRHDSSLSSGSSASASSLTWSKSELSSKPCTSGSDLRRDFTYWNTNYARNIRPYTSRRRYTSGWQPINRALSWREDFIDCKSNKKSGTNWSLIESRPSWAAPKSIHITVKSFFWRVSTASWKFLRSIGNRREKRLQRKSKSLKMLMRRRSW